METYLTVKPTTLGLAYEQAANWLDSGSAQTKTTPVLKSMKLTVIDTIYQGAWTLQLGKKNRNTLEKHQREFTLFQMDWTDPSKNC